MEAEVARVAVRVRALSVQTTGARGASIGRRRDDSGGQRVAQRGDRQRGAAEVEVSSPQDNITSNHDDTASAEHEDDSSTPFPLSVELEDPQSSPGSSTGSTSAPDAAAPHLPGNDSAIIAESPTDSTAGTPGYPAPITGSSAAGGDVPLPDCSVALSNQRVPPEGLRRWYLRRVFGGVSPKGLRRRRTGFEPGEPGSSGWLDARGAGSSVTVAAKVVRVGPRVEACQVKAESAECGSG
ncbi:hypothetical protein GUJ93_ZPchr0005g16308 [Zizania palustris]|uniref:Uncharacterized protein n=1 Tax=Zizania palustris TaxID=103762 RepID=A0A8J5T4C9_ZIZPA|nr:hypothetical protein GUJ93_ZPchr0005g16308 [Zizania palustris]